MPSQTVFNVKKMDCPSEERLIRMALQGHDQIQNLSFDLSSRTIALVHTGDSEPLLKALLPLNLGASIKESKPLLQDAVLNIETPVDPRSERSVLIKLLIINGVMFFAEVILGWIAESTGLLADSLDMLADALVYGLSFYAVGKAVQFQNKAARMSGFLQVALAGGAMFEVIRRFIFGSEPHSPLMMATAAVALIANLSCLALLSKHRTGGVHMKASWIFSTNDVIANIGVIVAGLVVYFTKSPMPDLVIGSVIALVVLRGGIAILKLSTSVAPQSN